MTSQEFEDLLLPLAGEVERYLKSFCSDSHTVQDVVQDVYLKLWHNRNKLPNIVEPRAYLFRSARNTLIDTGFFKASKMKYEDKISTFDMMHETIDALKGTELKELAEVVLKLMKRLPAIQEEIVHLRDINGFENKEIAEILNESEVYVRVNLSRGRKMLREILVNEYQIEAYEI